MQNSDPGKNPIHHSLCLLNYNKTHKSRLKYEIKYDMHEIAQKIITEIIVRSV